MLRIPAEVGSIPADTARVATAVFPEGTLIMHIREAVGPLFETADFAALFPRLGQPALDPACLALVTIFQYLEGVSDRQAAHNVRRCIDWKYALALPLEDQGFDASVLSEFRTRLLEGHAEQGLFNTVLTCLRERGLPKARGRQRTDSTHVLAAIRTLNRLACVAETLRHALNDLADVAPQWLRAQITPDWFDRYRQRVEEYRLPTDKAERQQLAETIGRDGFALLTALDAPQRFPVRGMKEEEKLIEGAPDRQQKATAPACTTPECRRPRSAGQGTVRGKVAGKRIRTDKKIARDVDCGAQREGSRRGGTTG